MTFEVDFHPTRVLEIELTKPIPMIEFNLDGRQYRDAYAVLTINQRPVATCFLSPLAAQRHLSPAQVASAIWQTAHDDINYAITQQQRSPLTELLPNGLSASVMPAPLRLEQGPHITVNICTKDRTNWLKQCLPGLFAQTYTNFDVVIIDNAPSTPDTANYIRDHYGSETRLRYVHEPVAGLSVARNRGLAESQGEIVAMTDDDVRVPSNWLESIARTFTQHPYTACVTGPLFPAELETPAQLWVEQFAGGFNRGLTPRLFDMKANRPRRPFFYPYLPGIVGTGANMAFRSEVIRELGGFSPYLGLGTPCRGGEDLDMFFRVITSGRQIAYTPEVYLYHYHRREYEGLLRQIEGYGTASSARLTKWFLEKPSRIPGFLLKLPYIPYVLLFSPSDDLKRRQQYQHSYPTELRQVEQRGMLAGPLAYLKSRLTPIPDPPSGG